MSEQPHPPEHERPGYLCWCGTVHQRGDGLWTGGDHVKRSTIIMIIVAVLALTMDCALEEARAAATATTLPTEPPCPDGCPPASHDGLYAGPPDRSWGDGANWV